MFSYLLLRNSCSVLRVGGFSSESKPIIVNFTINGVGLSGVGWGGGEDRTNSGDDQ